MEQNNFSRNPNQPAEEIEKLKTETIGTEEATENTEPEDISVNTKLEEEVDKIKIGIVIGCEKLNVRKEPSTEAGVVCVVEKQTELIVDEEESTPEFYKVCTPSEVTGFCMKKFIGVQP